MVYLKNTRLWNPESYKCNVSEMGAKRARPNEVKLPVGWALGHKGAVVGWKLFNILLVKSNKKDELFKCGHTNRRSGVYFLVWQKRLPHICLTGSSSSGRHVPSQARCPQQNGSAHGAGSVEPHDSTSTATTRRESSEVLLKQWNTCCGLQQKWYLPTIHPVYCTWL